MEKLNYAIEINATPEHVHSTMLGLQHKKTYEQWTSAFDPTSSWEGHWGKNSKIIFTAIRDGKRGGMVARILENIPGEFVSIQHYGVLNGDEEITQGPAIEGWANAIENYRFERIGDHTLVTIEVDTKEEYIPYFNEAWPKALALLKSGCEAGV